MKKFTLLVLIALLCAMLCVPALADGEKEIKGLGFDGEDVSALIERYERNFSCPHLDLTTMEFVEGYEPPAIRLAYKAYRFDLPYSESDIDRTFSEFMTDIWQWVIISEENDIFIFNSDGSLSSRTKLPSDPIEKQSMTLEVDGNKVKKILSDEKFGDVSEVKVLGGIPYGYFVYFVSHDKEYIIPFYGRQDFHELRSGECYEASEIIAEFVDKYEYDLEQVKLYNREAYEKIDGVNNILWGGSGGAGGVVGNAAADIGNTPADKGSATVYIVISAVALAAVLSLVIGISLSRRKQKA